MSQVGGSLMVFLELRQETCGTFRVPTGTAVNLSWFVRDMRLPF